MKWHVEPLGGQMLNVVDEYGKPVAFTGVSEKLRSNEENERNARLIAAAPELLEACKLLGSVLTNGGLRQAEIEQIQQALKKAE